MGQEEQQSQHEMTLDEFRRQVVQCLITKEYCSEKEANDFVSKDLEYQLADGVKTGAELLLEFYEEGLFPLTAAEVFMEL